MKIPELLLASESPRRRELLTKVVEHFQVEGPSVEELKSSSGLPPRELVRQNAFIKAAAAAERHPDRPVLGADTIVVLGDRTFGKPRDLVEAADFLRTFSGKTHEVLTAISLQWRNLHLVDTFATSTQVKFRKLDEKAIQRYLALVPVLDKAGAYGIQEHGEEIIEGIQGELDNVIGLPTSELQKHWNDFLASAQQLRQKR